MRRLAPYLVLLAEVLAFYRHVLFYGGYVIPWDLRYYHLPIAEFVARSFRNGELPLWNPYSYCGTPIYANITTQLFYPPTVVTIWLSNLAGGDNLLYFLEWQIVLHVFLGGVFAFWLLRRLGAATAPALLGATVFQLGGFFASQTQHLGAMNAAAWLPLAWLSVASLAARFRWRWLAVLAFSFAMSILAGFPAVAAVAMAASLMLAVVLRMLGQARTRLLWAVLGACIWAALLSAVQVLPTAELTQLSVAKFRGDWMGTGGGLPLQSLMSLLIPGYYGIFDLSTYTGPWQPTFLYIYCGVAGIVLALAAVFLRRDRHGTAYGWIAGLSALWMLGDSTPAGKLLFPLLPDLVKSAIYPEFAMLAFMLAVAVLAGLGAQRCFDPKKKALGAALVAVTALDLLFTGSGRPMNTGSLAQEPGLTRAHFDGSKVVLDRMRRLVRLSRPPGRVDTVNDSMNWAMGAVLTEIPTANGNDPFALIRLMQVRLSFTRGERWGRYYEVSNLDSPVLDLLNVRYVLSRTRLDSRQVSNFAEVAQLPGRHVYENPEALPRFFLVNRIRRADGIEAALAALRAPGFNPREIAVVEGVVDFDEAETAAPPRAVKVLSYGPREVALETDSPVPAFLVTSETYYPGWRAFLDGQPRPLALVNVAFRGLPVPAGRHTVVMRFEPSILWRSAALSGVAWLAALAAFVFVGDNRRKRGSWISSSN